jgi:hypothetical protein
MVLTLMHTAATALATTVASTTATTVGADANLLQVLLLVYL